MFNLWGILQDSPQMKHCLSIKIFIFHLTLNFIFLLYINCHSLSKWYDDNIVDSNGTDCYGLRCYCDYYVICMIFTTFSLGLFIWLFIRECTGKVKKILWSMRNAPRQSGVSFLGLKTGSRFRDHLFETMLNNRVSV